MTHKYLIDPYKFFISITTVLACLVLTFVIVFSLKNILGLFLLLPIIPFSCIAYIYGGFLIITPEAVTLTRLNRTIRTMSWKDISEFGVLGTKVFNYSDKNKTGSMYIYFSASCLSPEKRFDLALRWPPREQLFLLFTNDRMNKIRPLWDGEVTAYNTGSKTKF